MVALTTTSNRSIGAKLHVALLRRNWAPHVAHARSKLATLAVRENSLGAGPAISTAANAQRAADGSDATCIFF